MTGSPRRKVTLRQLHQMKAERRRIVALGVYDAPMAAIADEIGFELFVIGNSGPMSLFGYRDSARVPPEALFHMTLGVSRGAQASTASWTVDVLTMAARAWALTNPRACVSRIQFSSPV